MWYGGFIWLLFGVILYLIVLGFRFVVACFWTYFVVLL